MILINLLPVELRRRHSAVNPVFLGLVGAGVLCLTLGLFYIWLTVEIRNAQVIKKDAEDELIKVTAAADEVRTLEKTIDDHKRRLAQSSALLDHKVFWAHTLDDFVTMLNGPWKTPSAFDIRCTDLSITEGGGAGDRGTSDTVVSFDFVWHYKLLGKDRSYSGSYMDSFLTTIKTNKFWTEQGFIGKPDDSYHGDKPTYNAAIQRTIISGSLIWHRVKDIKETTAGGR
jgi:hypothetical protein